MKDKLEILKKAYTHLYGIGMVASKTDFSEKLEVNYTNLTSAFSGNDRYLTKNLFKKINEQFVGIFNLDWLTTGEGEMLKNSTFVPDYNTESEIKISIPYEFVQSIFEERKQHNDKEMELIRQNGELIDMLKKYH